MPNSDEKKVSTQETKEAIKRYILEEFLPGEDPAELTDSTPLITGGILDSLATIKLVVFLEERFQIQIQAHETMVDYLNTISDIAQLVQSKF
jgi:acyl carrier protein